MHFIPPVLCNKLCLNDTLMLASEIAAKGKRLAAFYCESILGCPGQIPLPAGYLRATYEHVRKAGGVCVADEVQVLRT